MTPGGQLYQELNRRLSELRLPAIRGCYEEKARQAERETLAYEQYRPAVTKRPKIYAKASAAPQSGLRESGSDICGATWNARDFNIRPVPRTAIVSTANDRSLA